MGISLFDLEKEEIIFQINFWNWRAIVEELRRLEILSDELVDNLHQQFCGYGLNKMQCALVAEAIEKMVVPSISDNQRILLNGERTADPDTYVFYRDDWQENYSTTKDILERFAASIRNCNGFDVC